MLVDSHRQAGKPLGNHRKESGCPSHQQGLGMEGLIKADRKGSKGTARPASFTKNFNPFKLC